MSCNINDYTPALIASTINYDVEYRNLLSKSKYTVFSNGDFAYQIDKNKICKIIAIPGEKYNGRKIRKNEYVVCFDNDEIGLSTNDSLRYLTHGSDFNTPIDEINITKINKYERSIKVRTGNSKVRKGTRIRRTSVSCRTGRARCSRRDI